MPCEPVLLAAPLAAVLSKVLDTNKALVRWNELLLKLFAIKPAHCLSVILIRIVNAGQLAFPDLVLRALGVLALRRVDHPVVRRLGQLRLVCTNIHHLGVVEASRCHE